MLCEPLVQHPPSPKATALNPAVLLEVTSDSSEEFDTRDKLEYYRTIPSLREYVIVSHRERRITVHGRVAGGAWETHVATKDGEVDVASLGVKLSANELYRNSAVR